MRGGKGSGGGVVGVEWEGAGKRREGGGNWQAGVWEGEAEVLV